MPNPDATHQDPTPDSLEARKLFAAALLRLKERDFGAALPLLARAAKLQQHYPEVYKAMSLAFLAQDDRPRGLKALRLAAESFLVLGRLAEAVETVRKLQALDPDAANPILHMADALLAKGRADKAETLYKLVLETGAKPDAAKAAEALKRCHPLPPDDEVLDPDAQFMEEIVLAESQAPEEKPHSEALPQQDFVEKRRSFRLALFDLSLRLAKRKTSHAVANLSLFGIDFSTHDESFSCDEVLVFDLLTLDAVKIKKLKVRIRHVTEGAAGGVFLDLTAKQTKQLQTLCDAAQADRADVSISALKGDATLNLKVGTW